MRAEGRVIIDLLAGIESGSSLDVIRARRLQARENVQKSYLALFEPIDFGDVDATERCAVASFVAGLHGEPNAAGFYLDGVTGRPPRSLWRQNESSLKLMVSKKNGVG